MAHRGHYKRGTSGFHAEEPDADPRVPTMSVVTSALLRKFIKDVEARGNLLTRVASHLRDLYLEGSMERRRTSTGRDRHGGFVTDACDDDYDEDQTMSAAWEEAYAYGADDVPIA